MLMIRSIHFHTMEEFEKELNNLIEINKGFKFKSIISKSPELAEIMLESNDDKQLLKD